ncbi:MAG: class II aldolase/adducin family protein [Alkalispirochaetaceae bacterium]
MSQAEGYIKFNQEFRHGPPPPWDTLRELNLARTRLFDLGLIGMDEDGTGFGNVSVRSPKGEAGLFMVSGTATGNKRVLEPEDYAVVLDYDIARNNLASLGRTRASSESLSHAAVYSARGDVVSVIHVHSRPLYAGMLKEGFPRTSPEAEYGTPEIATDIRDIAIAADEASGALVMLAHQDGVIAYGGSVQEAEALLAALYERFAG